MNGEVVTIEAVKTGYQPYADYKKSVVDEIPIIPSHWSEIRCRFLLKDGYEGLKIGPFGSQIKSDQLSASGYKIYGQENVIHNDFSLGKRYLDENKFAELQVYEIKPGDILITMMGTAGKCKIVPQDISQGIMDSHLIRLRVKNRIVPDFLKYLVDQSDYVKSQIHQLGKGSVMHGLNSTIIKALEIVLPPINEQILIIEYLNKKMREIDSLIEKKERFIELLQEKRTALITHAVTKGLDPDVPMKDSGVEWLGEIPEHWDVIPLKRNLIGITDGTHGSFERKNSKYPLLSAKNICNSKITISGEESCISEEDYKEIIKNGFPQKGDLIITCVGTIGKSCIYDFDEPFAFQRSVCFLRFNRKVSAGFIKFFVDSSYFQDYLLSVANVSAQGGVYMGTLKNSKIPIPPLEEQIHIVDSLERITKKSELLINKTRNSIELLKEYRTALITAAVTGKIDLREEVVS
jgi:type I restriction enzyme S subunit